MSGPIVNKAKIYMVFQGCAILFSVCVCVCVCVQISMFKIDFANQWIL